MTLQLGSEGSQGPPATGNMWAKRHLSGRNGSSENGQWLKPGTGEELAETGVVLQVCGTGLALPQAFYLPVVLGA